MTETLKVLCDVAAGTLHVAGILLAGAGGIGAVLALAGADDWDDPHLGPSLVVASLAVAFLGGVCYVVARAMDRMLTGAAGRERRPRGFEVKAVGTSAPPRRVLPVEGGQQPHPNLQPGRPNP